MPPTKANGKQSAAKKPATKKLTKVQLNKQSLQLNEENKKELVKMQVCIVIDCRETHVIPYFENFISLVNAKYKFEKITTVTKQIITSDFCISIGGIPKMIIERKTWKDLAGSIRDKRVYEQTQKMLKLKQQFPDCLLLFIIEGVAYPSKNSFVPGGGKFKYNNLLAKLDHTFVRDGIPYRQTKNELHTAETIVDLANTVYEIEKERQTQIEKNSNLNNEKNSNLDVDGSSEPTSNEPISNEIRNETQEPISNEIRNNDITNEVLVTNGSNSHLDNEPISNEIRNNIEETTANESDFHLDNEQDLLQTEVEERNELLNQVPDILTTKSKKEANIIYLEIISSIPGVGETVAHYLYNKYTLKQILLNEISAEELSSCVLPSGRKIGTKSADNIKNQVKKTDVQQKMLTKVNGVSKDKAIIIINNYKIEQFINGEVDVKTLGKLQITSNRKLGPAVSQRILDTFSENLT